MFDPSGFDLQGLLSQAQAMQDQLEAAQAELANQRVTGSDPLFQIARPILVPAIEV